MTILARFVRTVYFESDSGEAARTSFNRILDVSYLASRYWEDWEEVVLESLRYYVGVTVTGSPVTD